MAIKIFDLRHDLGETTTPSHLMAATSTPKPWLSSPYHVAVDQKRILEARAQGFVDRQETRQILHMLGDMQSSLQQAHLYAQEIKGYTQAASHSWLQQSNRDSYQSELASLKEALQEVLKQGFASYARYQDYTGMGAGLGEEVEIQEVPFRSAEIKENLQPIALKLREHLHVIAQVLEPLKVATSQQAKNAKPSVELLSRQLESLSQKVNHSFVGMRLLNHSNEQAIDLAFQRLDELAASSEKVEITAQQLAARAFSPQFPHGFPDLSLFTEFV